jgi:Tfp pilus assembly protein PilF
MSLPMEERVKILFLAANPADASSKLRLDEEIREIDQKIRVGTHRDRIELVSAWAVRVGDLQQALLRHKPDIVHFSGHGRKNKGIVLEDRDRNSQVVNKQAVAKLFRILKDNIRVVVLNACYAKDQAMAVAETIDFVVGMNAAIRDQAAIIFSAYFYQSLAFGRTVKEAFELAVNQIELEGMKGAQIPELLVRSGADSSQSKLVPGSLGAEELNTESRSQAEQSVSVGGSVVHSNVIVGDGNTLNIAVSHTRGNTAAREQGRSPLALLPWLLAVGGLIPLVDIFRRVFGGEAEWLDVAGSVAEPALVVLAVIASALIGVTFLPERHPLFRKAANLPIFRKQTGPKRLAAILGIVLVVLLCLWLSLPLFAPFCNDRGIQLHDQDASRARQWYERAVRLRPGFAEAHYNLASAYEDSAAPQKAVDEYRLSIKYDSHIYPAYNNLARLYLKRGEGNDYKDALNLLVRARDLSPQDESLQDENTQYTLYKNLGWANYELGDYLQAEQDLRGAISHREDRAAAHCLLAYVLKKLGKAGMAAECYDCVSYSKDEEDLEENWLSDAKDCVMKGAIK